MKQPVQDQAEGSNFNIKTADFYKEEHNKKDMDQLFYIKTFFFLIGYYSSSRHHDGQHSVVTEIIVQMVQLFLHQEIS